MQETKIYVEFSEEIEYLLSENKINLPVLLQEENIDAIIAYEYKPYDNNIGERSKDMVLTLVGSSVLILAIGEAFSRIIKTLHDKPTIVKVSNIEPICDINGNLIHDAFGQPLLTTSSSYQLLTPKIQDVKKVFSIEVNQYGIRMKYDSLEKGQTDEITQK